MKSYLLIITFLTLISCSTKSPKHTLKSVTHCLEAKDTDKDGLPDSYEIKYKLNPNKNDSFIDSDNDGFSNLEEWKEGTHPNNHSEHPSLLLRVTVSKSEENQFLLHNKFTGKTTKLVLREAFILKSLNGQKFKFKLSSIKPKEVTIIDYKAKDTFNIKVSD